MVILKTKEEINKIQIANKIIAELLNNILPQYIKPGISTWELDKIAENYIIKQGARSGFKGYKVGKFTFPATICTTVNEEVVHGIPSKKKILKVGDIIGIDIGTIVEGYYGDAAKTFAVGKISDYDKRLLEITEQAVYIGIKKAKVGNRVSDIGNAIQKFIEKQGFVIIKNYCGHGVGKYLHEEPKIPNFGKKGIGSEIKNGMVFTIEPIVTTGKYKIELLANNWTTVMEEKQRSAHFEHTIAIVDGVAKILSEV